MDTQPNLYLWIRVVGCPTEELCPIAFVITTNFTFYILISIYFCFCLYIYNILLLI